MSILFEGILSVFCGDASFLVRYCLVKDNVAPKAIPFNGHVLYSHL